MQSRQYIPAAPLSSYVRCFWYWEGIRQPHAKEKLLPNGEFAIIFNLVDEPLRIYDAQDLTQFRSYGVAVLSGARANCFAIDTDQQERVVGIEFKPGGAFPFLNMPACEAEGACISLTDVWPGWAGYLREQLLSCLSVRAMFAVLEKFLRARLTLDVHPAVRYAVEQFQRVGDAGSVGRVTEQIGLSSRRFLDLFHDQVGLTPKVFTRVRRFQRVLEMLHRPLQPNWAELALNCGFYDQAHFIHEFRNFAGLTPTAYFAVSTPHLNHLPVTP